MAESPNDLFHGNPDSSDKDDLFKPGDNVSSEDSDKNWYEELVGEGKKFKDNNALARSVSFKDQHISKIEQENAELRQRVKQGLTLEEFYDKIRSQNPPSNQPEPNGVDERDGNELSVEQVDALIKRHYEQRSAEEKGKENLRYVQEEARKALGPDFQHRLRERAAELGEAEADLANLAMVKPKVFLELMVPKNVQEPPKDPSLPRSQVNTSDNDPAGGVIRNQSWYDNLKKSDPERFAQSKTQAQMHRDAIRLGESFFQ